jgi:hypothetical protein
LVNLVESGEIKPAFDFRGKASSRSCMRIPREALMEFLESRKIIAVAPVKGRKNSS